MSKRLREQLSRSRYAHWGRVLGRSSVSEGTPSHVEGVGAQATPQPCADHNVAHTLWVLKAFHLSPATRCACPAWAVCARKGSGHMYVPSVSRNLRSSCHLPRNKTFQLQQLPFTCSPRPDALPPLARERQSNRIWQCGLAYAHRGQNRRWAHRCCSEC